MEVILLERVAKLGQMGDIVSVKDGFARNFLLPQSKALRATEANKQKFEAQKAQLEAQNLERKSEAEAVAAKLDGMQLVVIRQASEKGQLYGSVNARDIAAAVTEAGVTIARTQINIATPIKTLGIYAIDVNLHAEVTSSVEVNVARSEEEAEMQAAGETIESRAAAEEAEARAEAEELLSEMGAAAREDDDEAPAEAAEEATA